MAEQGVETTAFDASAVAVVKARALAEARRVAVDYHVAEVESWRWEPERFDLVVAIFIQFLEPRAERRRSKTCNGRYARVAGFSFTAIVRNNSSVARVARPSRS